jgi:hypothetical protein
MASQMVDNKREAFSQLICSPLDSVDVAGVEGAISLCRNRGARRPFLCKGFAKKNSVFPKPHCSAEAIVCFSAPSCSGRVAACVPKWRMRMKAGQ